MSRRPRPFREVRSIKPRRQPYDYVLIVCEGSKTEPDYLASLIRDLRLSSANVEIVGEECGSNPGSIVDYAVRRFDEVKEFDRVYCVFDRDSHPDFRGAVDRCRSLRRRGGAGVVPFAAITSVPCFEYWLILHVSDSSRPYTPCGARSAGENCAHHLRELTGSYSKGDKSIYERLKNGINDAIQRARRGRQQGLDNPSTNVDELVLYLRGIVAPRERE